MRLAALALLAAGSVSAQTYTWDVTITPENGGADSRVSWEFAGTYARSFPMDILLSGINFGGNVNGLKPFDATPSPSIFEIGNTGIIGTNSRTAATAQVTRIRLFDAGSSSFVVFTVTGGDGPSGDLDVKAGDTLSIVAPASGSYVIDQDFSLFNNGYWAFVDGATRQSLTISGTPIPEPSTYGLILGGLALAGAAIRRRRAK